MYFIPLISTDFVNGSLPVTFNIRPGRIFTAGKNIIIEKAGTISDNKKLGNHCNREHIKIEITIFKIQNNRFNGFGRN